MTEVSFFKLVKATYRIDLIMEQFNITINELLDKELVRITETWNKRLESPL